MITVRRYTPADAAVWDAFVSTSKNGTFLFMRHYMDYHADRFCDHSLLCYNEKERLVALLPGNEVQEADRRLYYSHQGLSYGGFVLSLKSTMEEVMQLFDATIAYLTEAHFKVFYYKQVPSIYHLYPAQEDEYALFRHHAVLDVCNISCTVSLQSPFAPKIDYTRRRRCQKNIEAGYMLRESGDLAIFWPIMTDNLRRRYQAAPVHTLDEMRLLQSRFPQNIKCYLAVRPDAGQGEVVTAGALIYETQQTVHVQYGHSTPAGKEEGALDFLYTTLIEQYRNRPTFLYFDFGTSNEQGGQFLNETLIAQKEGFAGRGIAARTFWMPL